MDEVKRISMLQTWHQCYTMVEAVFHAFRSHLEYQDALHFAAFLPPVLRAIFVDEWDVSKPVTPFPERAELQGEVLALRSRHNMSTETAIEDVAQALWLNVDKRDFERVLAGLPEDAARFWTVQGNSAIT